jgi:hypothetical protein
MLTKIVTGTNFSGKMLEAKKKLIKKISITFLNTILKNIDEKMLAALLKNVDNTSEKC